MKYCSDCGGRLVPGKSGLEGQERPMCQVCGRIFYGGPRILVACVAYRAGRVLMCQRAHDPDRGRWIAPCGFMEDGEYLEQAAARETMEETGVVVDPERMVLYSLLSLPGLNEVWVTFRIELLSEPELIVGPESLDVRMIAETDLAPGEYAFSESLKGRPAAIFNEVRTGLFETLVWRLESPEHCFFGTRA